MPGDSRIHTKKPPRTKILVGFRGTLTLLTGLRLTLQARATE